jgi:hypothetical protein
MPKHRTYNWPQLLDEFSQSSLSQVEFCKQRNINPTYFSLKLSKRKALEAEAFAKVVVQPTQSAAGLVLEIGNCKIHCPATMPIPTLVSLVKFLA